MNDLPPEAETKPSNSTGMAEPPGAPLKQRSGRTVAVSQVIPAGGGARVGVGASTTRPLQTSTDSAINFGISSVPGRGLGLANTPTVRNVNDTRQHHRFACIPR